MDILESLVLVVRNITDKAIYDNYTVKKKSQGNFVTSVDLQIEAELIRSLKMLLPNSSILSEEKGDDNENTEYRWIIDPIDGTTNFIYGLDYTTSVALEHVPTKETVLGVVYAPKDDIVYYASKDKGSFKRVNGTETKLHVGKFEENEGLAIFGIPYDRSKTDRIFEIAKEQCAHASDLKRIGPASLDICRVASGTAKTYCELDLKEWDIAAGILILKEAGGYVKHIDDLWMFSSNPI